MRIELLPSDATFRDAVDGAAVGALTTFGLLLAIFWRDSHILSRGAKFAIIFALAGVLIHTSGAREALHGHLAHADGWRLMQHTTSTPCIADDDESFSSSVCDMVQRVAGPLLQVTQQEARLLASVLVAAGAYTLAAPAMSMVRPLLAGAVAVLLLETPWVLLGGDRFVPPLIADIMSTMYAADLGALSAFMTGLTSMFHAAVSAPGIASLDGPAALAFATLMVTICVWRAVLVLRALWFHGPAAAAAAAQKSALLAAAAYVLHVHEANPLLLPFYWLLHADYMDDAEEKAESEEATTASRGVGDVLLHAWQSFRGAWLVYVHAPSRLGLTAPTLRLRARIVGYSSAVLLLAFGLTHAALMARARFAAVSILPDDSACIALSSWNAPSAEGATILGSRGDVFTMDAANPLFALWHRAWSTGQMCWPQAHGDGDAPVMALAAARTLMGITIVVHGAVTFVGVGVLSLISAVTCLSLDLHDACVSVTAQASTIAPPPFLTIHARTSDMIMLSPWALLRLAMMYAGVYLVLVGTPARGGLDAIARWSGAQSRAIRATPVAKALRMVDVLGLLAAGVCASVVYVASDALLGTSSLSATILMMPGDMPALQLTALQLQLLAIAAVLLLPRDHLTMPARAAVAAAQTLLGAMAILCAVPLPGGHSGAASGQLVFPDTSIDDTGVEWCMERSFRCDRLADLRIFFASLVVGSMLKLYLYEMHRRGGFAPPAKPAPEPTPIPASIARAAAARRRRGSDAAATVTSPAAASTASSVGTPVDATPSSNVDTPSSEPAPGGTVPRPILAASSSAPSRLAEAGLDVDATAASLRDDLTLQHRPAWASSAQDLRSGDYHVGTVPARAFSPLTPVAPSPSLLRAFGARAPLALPSEVSRAAAASALARAHASSSALSDLSVDTTPSVATDPKPLAPVVAHARGASFRSHTTNDDGLMSLSPYASPLAAMHALSGTRPASVGAATAGTKRPVSAVSSATASSTTVTRHVMSSDVDMVGTTTSAAGSTEYARTLASIAPTVAGGTPLAPIPSDAPDATADTDDASSVASGFEAQAARRAAQRPRVS